MNIKLLEKHLLFVLYFKIVDKKKGKHFAYTSKNKKKFGLNTIRINHPY